MRCECYDHMASVAYRTCMQTGPVGKSKKAAYLRPYHWMCYVHLALLICLNQGWTWSLIQHTMMGLYGVTNPTLIQFRTYIQEYMEIFGNLMVGGMSAAGAALTVQIDETFYNKGNVNKSRAPQVTH